MYVKELTMAQVNYVNKKVQRHIKNGRVTSDGMKVMRNELITLGWVDENGKRIIAEEKDQPRLSKLGFSIANQLADVISDMSGMQRESDEDDVEEQAEDLD